MSTGLADIPKGWEVVEQTPVPKGWEVIPFDENATKFAEAASDRITQLPLNIGFDAVAYGTPPEYREHVARVFQARLQAGEGGGKKLKERTGGLTALNFVEGALDFAAPLARSTGIIPRLDHEQELFKQQLQAIQQGEDPLLSKGIAARSTQQAARMAFPMVSAVGAGKVLRAGAGVLGLGAKAQTAAAAAGVSGSFYPMIHEQTYSELLGSGIDPDTAKGIALVSAPIEAAIASILPDPLSGYSAAFRGTARQVAKNLLIQHAKNYGKELSEESLQGMVRAAGIEVGRRMDVELPDQGLGDILQAGLDSTLESAVPLAMMMAPGAAVSSTVNVAESRQRPGRLNELTARREQLKEIRSKGWVSADDGQLAGIPGETRKERMENADAEIQQIEKEIQDAQQEQVSAPTDAGGGARVETEIPQGAEPVSGEGIRGGGQEVGQVPGEEAEVLAKPRADEPPLAEGMTRLYHGSAEQGRYEGPAWFSTNREYAANYRESAELQYVDVPTDWVNKEADPDAYGNIPDKGFTFNVELDSTFTGPRKPLTQTEPTGEVAPAPEVQVVPTESTPAVEDKSRGVKPVEPVQPVEPPADLARRAARGEVIERPEGISEARWRAMISQQAKRLGLKPPTTVEQAPAVPAEAPQQPQPPEPAAVPEVQPEATQEAKTDVPEFGTDVSQALGISAGVPLAGQRGTGQSVRHFFKRFFTTQGELPAEVYDAKVRKEGRVAKEMNTLKNTSTDFRRGIRKALGGKELTQADVEQMNAVLRSEEAPSTVPENVRAPLQAMRDHIDALSRAMIAEGVAQGDLVGIIEQNEGVYATRSYRVFDDPKWRDKVPEGIRNRAVAEIRQMHPDKSDAEVAGMLESLLFRGAADTPVALLKGSKLGSKDLSTFMKRKDIPEWLRDLWGEYKDAGVNYARSVFKMSHLLANQQFLNRVRAEGMGKWLRTQEEGPIVNEFGEVITPIAAEGSSVMSPLNGLLTTPEIKKAFERFDSPGAMPEWLRLIMAANYAVKYSKTVLSMMTHIRNTISNTGFAVANGHWRLDKAGKAIWATATGTFQLPDAEFRDYYNRLVELGIVGEDVRAGELKDALRDASQANIDEFLYNREARHAKKIVNLGRAGFRLTESLYQAEDAVWKSYGWENEKARYAKAYPAWSQQQVEEHAASIVRNGYPTYSKIPEGIKFIRRLPFIGPFVSFSSEVVRTTFHTIKLSMEEMQASETRSIGAQRLAGTAMAIGGLSVLTRGVMSALGIGDDEDDDLRWFLPPWEENSQLLYTAKPENGTYSFIDLGYSDPHAYLTDPVTAFMRGEDWKDSLVNSLSEFLAPFASEEILAKAMMDVRSNADGKVYNPEDEAGEQAKDITEYMWQHALEPGTITSMRRIKTAMEGTDPNRDVTTEITAVLTGQRHRKVDVEHSLGFRVREFGKALTRIQGIARKTATSRGTATGEMVATDLARMEKLRLAKFSEMQRIVGAARRLGVPEENIRGMLVDELPDDVAEQLMTGDYSPYEMTPQTAQQMLQANPKEFLERFAAWHGDELPEAIHNAAMPKIGNLPLTDKPEDGRTRAETKQLLDGLGISHDQAKQLLVDYYRRPNKSGKKQSERRADDPTKFDPSYVKRRRALRELYGSDE